MTQTLNGETKQYINQLLASNHWQSVGELAEAVQKSCPATKEEIAQYVVSLQAEGKIKLVPKAAKDPFRRYLFSGKSLWYWVTLVMALSAVVFALAVPNNVYPLFYVRIAFGLALTLWLPGFTIVNALFPVGISTKKDKKSNDLVLLFALSIAVSLAVSPLVGVALNFSPWGATAVPVVLSLMVLSVAFASVGLMRKYPSAQN
jgi:hypothetical protein